jgi:hypothetical protein
MRSLTGLFPAGRPFSSAFVAAGLLLVAAMPGRAEMPDYVRTALNTFSAEPPAGWAYTLTTVRNGEAQATARFDPTKPADEQWTLLELNGRPPTAGESAQFARSRADDTTPGSAKGAFQKRDIDPASVTLLAENPDRGEFRCRFRPEAAGADKMLAHLVLRLTVARRAPHVEKFVLELEEPYSPILGVKMRELRVEMNFTPPAAERPSLPAKQSSHFLGRIFLIGTEENLVLTYTDFAKP